MFTQLGVSNNIDLLQIAVVGGQSAGKSSVLEILFGKGVLWMFTGLFKLVMQKDIVISYIILYYILYVASYTISYIYFAYTIYSLTNPISKL